LRGSLGLLGLQIGLLRLRIRLLCLGMSCLRLLRRFLRLLPQRRRFGVGLLPARLRGDNGLVTLTVAFRAQRRIALDRLSQRVELRLTGQDVRLPARVSDGPGDCRNSLRGIDGLLGEKHAIAHPVMLHIPQEDHFVDKAAQQRMHDGLDDHPKVTLHDYPGEDHGFATEFGNRRSDAAARLADERTASFFAEALG